ncbi:hypothetical protein R6Q57_012374, partial [Mikania cordata]
FFSRVNDMWTSASASEISDLVIMVTSPFLFDLAIIVAIFSSDVIRWIARFAVQLCGK